MRVPSNRQNTPAPASRPAQPNADAPAPTIEADVGLRLSSGGKLSANGTVSLTRVFVERLIRHLTRKKKTFDQVDMAYDPATKTYAGTLKVKVKGIGLNLVGSVRPTSSGNQPAFQIVDLGLKLGPFTLRNSLLTRLATSFIARALRGSDIGAEVAGKGLVRMEPSSLLHEIRVLPAGFDLDGTKTRMDVVMADNGDVAVRMKADAPAQTNESDRSDMAVQADSQALMGALAPLLAPDYLLSGVTVGQDSITLDGKVEATPLSDVVNAGKTLILLLAAAGGRRAVNANAEHVMVPLRLSVKLEGTEAVLTPSLGPALGKLEKTLQKAGANPVREGKSLRFDLKKLGAKYGLEQIKATPEGVTARARLNIPELLNPPILRGEA